MAIYEMHDMVLGLLLSRKKHWCLWEWDLVCVYVIIYNHASLNGHSYSIIDPHIYMKPTVFLSHSLRVITELRTSMTMNRQAIGTEAKNFWGFITLVYMKLWHEKVITVMRSPWDIIIQSCPSLYI